MEQEVQAHVKKVYKAWNDPRKKFWEKVKEIILEIIIIVFAVSLSIWLHSWSEKRHEQAQVKSFLIGLKADLEDDLSQAKYCIQSLKNKDSLINGLIEKPIDSMDMIAKKEDINIYWNLFSNSWIRENNNRYEGFKGSGKIDNIEDDSLGLKILYYYQGAMNQLKTSEHSWLQIQSDLRIYYDDNFISDKNSNKEFLSLIKEKKPQFLLRKLKPWKQFYERYEQLISVGTDVIKKINATYNLK